MSVFAVSHHEEMSSITLNVLGRVIKCSYRKSKLRHLNHFTMLHYILLLSYQRDSQQTFASKYHRTSFFFRCHHVMIWPCSYRLVRGRPNDKIARLHQLYIHTLYLQYLHFRSTIHFQSLSRAFRLSSTTLLFTRSLSLRAPSSRSQLPSRVRSPRYALRSELPFLLLPSVRPLICHNAYLLAPPYSASVPAPLLSISGMPPARVPLALTPQSPIGT